MTDTTPRHPSPSAATPLEPADPPVSVADGATVPRRFGRGWRLVLFSVLGVVLVLVVGTAAAGLWVRHALGNNVETFADPFAGLATRAPQQAVQKGQKPATNFLVLGSDSRISAGDPSQWEVGAQRTDAIMIVQVSGDRKRVSVMSIPRDSWVDVPGHGQAKINAAYAYGGPSLTIQTVEQLTGIHIDHFVIADFESFKNLTDEIGGVTINLKTPQTLAGTEFNAGAQLLDGEQALAYTRERKTLPNGDFDRVNRQQAWMRAIVAQALSNSTLSSPSKLYSFLHAVTGTMAVDEGFTIDDMQSLALEMRSLRSKDISFMTAPTAGTGMSNDGQSIVNLDPDADAALFEAFAGDTLEEYLGANPEAVKLLPATVN